jgi:hypothetical protein
MLPAVISILYLNNCSTIKDKITKNRLLVPLIYIPNPSLDEIDELEDFMTYALQSAFDIHGAFSGYTISQE